MKRIVVTVLMIIAAGTAAFAQTQKTLPEKVTFSGKLELVQGMVAVKEEGTTYFIPRLLRLTGFIEGLKEGAQVTVEGYARTPPRSSVNSSESFILATKLTLNGKDYDLSPRLSDTQNVPGFGPRFQAPGPRSQDPWGTNRFHNRRQAPGFGPGPRHGRRGW